GRDHTGTIRADQLGLLALHLVASANHIPHRNAFGDADHEIQPGLDCFIDRCGREWRWHIDDRGGRAGRCLGVGHGVKDRYAFEVLPALTWSHTRDVAVFPVGIRDAGTRVELPGLARDALRDDLGVLVDEDGHAV